MANARIMLASVAACTAVPTAVHAQEQEAASSGVADIVVTAQRREQKLQDVPIAVSVITADSMRASGISGTNDLSFAVPGLELGRQNGAIAPFIRGIGIRSTAPGEESAVPLYVDGVYMPTLSAGLLSLENVERIEVLKGPQGTLFGRNATAGVIQIITKEPKDTPQVDARLGYGNFDTVEGSIYAAGPISSGIRADITTYASHQNKGWGINRKTGNDVFRGSEYSTRTKWVFDLGEETELKLAADYSRVKPNTPPAYSPIKGKVLTTGSGAYAFTTGYDGFYNVNENRDVRVISKQWGANAQLRHSFGGIDFLSITSYRWNKVLWRFDQDGGPVNAVSADTVEPSKTWTQELQLLSNNDGAFQWIAGLYYYNNISKYSPISLYGTNPPFSIFSIDRFSNMKAESVAGFGQGTLEFSPATRLTGGLRYTHDERKIAGFDLRNGILFAPSVGAQKASFGKLTWRLSLDHRFSDGILTYAAVSRGFKSGVFSAVAYLDPAARPTTLDTYEVGFKSDLLDRRLRLNGSAFYNSFKDVQVQSQVVGGIKLNNAAKARTYGFELEAEARPVSDLSIRASVTYLNGKYNSYAGASFYNRTGTQTTGPAVGDASGFDTIYTPKLTSSLTADYIIPSSIGDFSVNGGWVHNDGFYFDPQNAVRQPSYNLVNASLAYRAEGGAWGIRLWGKNLARERYYTAIIPQTYGDTATPAAPRTYGVTLDMHLR